MMRSIRHDSGGRTLGRNPWLGFLVFSLGQLGMWQLGPGLWNEMVAAGPSTYEVVQDIIHGFDVVSFFASPFWGLAFGLFWFLPMHAIARPRGLLLHLLFGAFVQVYLHLVFLREGEFFGFLSTFRYMGAGDVTDILLALVKLALGLTGLFAGPVLLALIVRFFSRPE